MDGEIQYQFVGVELTPAIAMLLVKELLADGRPLHRAVLADRAADLHRARGGKSGGNTVNRVKKALALLRETGEVVNVNHGNWRLSGNGELGVRVAGNNEERFVSEEASHDGDLKSFRLMVEREVGTGSEAVYVYYYERDKRLAGYENRSTWPCKIGFSAGKWQERILGQGVATAHHSLPVVGLIIRTADGRALEKAAHQAPRLAGRAIPASPGTEWFETTPDAVQRWFQEYQRSLRLLGSGTAPKISTL